MDATSNPANLRAAPRSPAPETVWLSCRRVAGAGGELANGLLDLSAGGLQFLSREVLVIGDLLEIALRGVTTAENLRRRGEVRWLVEFGGSACCAGVRFLEPLPAEVIAALVHSPTAALDSDAFLFDEPEANRR